MLLVGVRLFLFCIHLALLPDTLEDDEAEEDEEEKEEEAEEEEAEDEVGVGEAFAASRAFFSTPSRKGRPLSRRGVLPEDIAGSMGASA
jgi:hypothetical protein